MLTTTTYTLCCCRAGHRPVQWSEVFDHFKYNLTKETIVHIWKSVTNVTEVVAGGYQVLVNVGYDALSWYVLTSTPAHQLGRCARRHSAALNIGR